jgi:8-oxo-dGTP pyrophosphatase MutT (NUDIX family)
MEQGAVLSAGPLRIGGVTRDHVLARFATAPLPGTRRGDHDLNPDLLPGGPLVRAAVLVPLVDRPQGLTILLTRRTDHLPAHAGQISFPGGRCESDDCDAVATALRETEEEIGLARDLVNPIGRLDTYITRTGFEVIPVVGLVAPPSSLRPDPDEVAEVFEVPLDFILDPASRQRHSRIDAGATRYFYVFPWGNYYIWGATAGMLVNLAELLRDPP